MAEVIATGIAPANGPINDCVRAGKHVSMVVIAEDPETGAITEGDIEAQTHQASPTCGRPSPRRAGR